MPGNKEALLTANGKSAVHEGADLMTVREFLTAYEPHLFDLMLDVKQALIEDNTKGTILGIKWNTPSETRIDHVLDPASGIVFTALPIYVWEAVYPV